MLTDWLNEELLECGRAFCLQGCGRALSLPPSWTNFSFIRGARKLKFVHALSRSPPPSFSLSLSAHPLHQSEREREKEREREREKERERKRERERERETERERKREREREREGDVEYVQNCYFYFWREYDGCLGTFKLSS